MKINKGSHEFVLPKEQVPHIVDARFFGTLGECACNKPGVQNTEENFIILFKFVCKKKK